MKTVTVLAMALVTFWTLPSPCRGAETSTIDSYAEPADAAPYVPDPVVIEGLSRIDRPITIVVFHGTWCKDCQREIPRFRKILKLAANPNFHMVDYEVNPQKQDVLGKFEQYGIQKVPTFIFIEGDRELGRIVEKPTLSLEDDFLSIVGGGR